MEVKWTVSALLDLQEIRAYIAGEKLWAAARVADRIRTSVDLLRRFPRLGREGRVSGTRELVVSRTPFLVAYLIKQDQIEILRVLHGAQKWPDHL